MNEDRFRVSRHGKLVFIVCFGEERDRFDKRIRQWGGFRKVSHCTRDGGGRHSALYTFSNTRSARAVEREVERSIQRSNIAAPSFNTGN